MCPSSPTSKYITSTFSSHTVADVEFWSHFHLNTLVSPQPTNHHRCFCRWVPLTMHVIEYTIRRALLCGVDCCNYFRRYCFLLQNVIASETRSSFASTLPFSSRLILLCFGSSFFCYLFFIRFSQISLSQPNFSRLWIIRYHREFLKLSGILYRDIPEPEIFPRFPRKLMTAKT